MQYYLYSLGYNQPFGFIYEWNYFVCDTHFSKISLALKLASKIPNTTIFGSKDAIKVITDKFAFWKKQANQRHKKEWFYDLILIKIDIPTLLLEITTLKFTSMKLYFHFEILANNKLKVSCGTTKGIETNCTIKTKTRVIKTNKVGFDTFNTYQVHKKKQIKRQALQRRDLFNLQKEKKKGKETSFFGSYSLPYVLDCLDYAILKSISMHWKTDLPTPWWTLFLTP